MQDIIYRTLLPKSKCDSAGGKHAAAIGHVLTLGDFMWALTVLLFSSSSTENMRVATPDTFFPSNLAGS